MPVRLLNAQLIVHDLCHVLQPPAFRLARSLLRLLPMLETRHTRCLRSEASRLAYRTLCNPPSHPIPEISLSLGPDASAETRARRRGELDVGCVQQEASAPAGHTGVDGRPLLRSPASSLPTPALTSVAVLRVRSYRAGDFLDSCGLVAGMCAKRSIFERGRSMRPGLIMSPVIGSNLHGGDGSRSGGNPRRLQRRLAIFNACRMQRFRISLPAALA
ncbi:hypothetical protein HPB50_005773 [Hyalomma asiaticum]|uniref:Uncharacterized protein n=1 Tax=Hyalomma asiaticum TaxID=266040 RepID=A0ACB7T5Q7_HYAAI|nr:hypothetical protein HPB50_005773 [Hyalomma asiaticum]